MVDINFSYGALEKEFESYINTANKKLAPIFFAFSSIVINTDNIVLKHSLVILAILVFLVFVKINYPRNVRTAKELKKYLRDIDPKLYAYIDGTIRHFESWNYFTKRGLPFVSSYFLFFLTWLFTI